MEWTISLTRRAEEDLAEIVRYIARDDPAASERFGAALVSRVESLIQQPDLGTMVMEEEGVRALLHRKYYIVYRCDAATAKIEVLRFWHSARDLGRVRLREPTDE